MKTQSEILQQIAANIQEISGILCAEPERFASIAGQKEEWTAPQIVAHLCQVHLHAIRSLKSSEPMPRRPLKQKIALPMMRFVLGRGIQVPTGGAMPLVDRDANLAPLLETLVKLQERLVLKCQVAGFEPGQFGFDHPLVGPLTKLETLEFLLDHLRYHIIRAKQR